MMHGYGQFGQGGFGGGAPYGFNPGWMAGPNLTSVLLLALIAFAMYVFFKQKNGSNGTVDKIHSSKSSSLQAEELVKLRYARGEITFDEFQSIISTIRS